MATEPFESVRTLFNAMLAADPAYSAQLAVYHQGVPVLDLVGGPEFDADSITGVFSCSKGVAALAFSLLVQDGVVDLDAKVTSYWPEFGQHGKDVLSVRQLLSHQAGVVGLPGGVVVEDYNDVPALAARLAGMVPLWRPGKAFGYHALIMGVLMEELCRRTTGRTLQEVYEERIRAPFEVDMFLGLPEDEEQRFKPVLFGVDPNAPFIDPASITGISANVAAGNILDLPNNRQVRAGGSTSGAGVGSARGLARVYAAASTGVEGSEPFLAPATIAAMSEEQVWGWDRTFSQESAFAVVFMKSHNRVDFGSARAFGHDGANGALGYADPHYEVGFGYVPRWCELGGTTGRAMQLSAAVRRAVLDLG